MTFGLLPKKGGEPPIHGNFESENDCKLSNLGVPNYETNPRCPSLLGGCSKVTNMVHIGLNHQQRLRALGKAKQRTAGCCRFFLCWSVAGMMRLFDSGTTYIHTYIRTYIHTYIQTYRHTDIQTYRHIHTYIQTDLPTYIPTYVRTYLHTYRHTYIYTYMHTYRHTYIHTYIRTYVHTYRQTYVRTTYITLHYITLHDMTLH